MKRNPTITKFAALLCLALAPAITRAEEKFFDAKGVKIHYVEKGAGEPIVLVHGFMGNAERWVGAGVWQNLARDHRVIALDCRGHGMSGKPHDSKQYGREMALDIVRLLDHLKISRAHIVGYSMGAQITALLLTLHPERFQTATLGGGAGRIDWNERDSARVAQQAAEIERYGFSPAQANRLAPPNRPPLSEEQIQQRSRAALANLKADRFAAAAVMRSQLDQVISSSQVAAVTVPTLGVAGSLDAAAESLRSLKKLRPGMKLVIIEGATHGGAMAQPEFVAAVREFVAAHAIAAAGTR